MAQNLAKFPLLVSVQFFHSSCSAQYEQLQVVIAFTEIQIVCTNNFEEFVPACIRIKRSVISLQTIQNIDTLTPKTRLGVK